MIANGFPALLQSFFTERLFRQRRASGHTIAGYRDAFRLLLRYAAQRLGTTPSKLRLEDLDASFIGQFLDHLEQERGNSARTRNARLGAIHSFFQYVALEEPAHALLCQHVLAMPNKHPRAAQRACRPQGQRGGPMHRALLGGAVSGLRPSDTCDRSSPACCSFEKARGSTMRLTERWPSYTPKGVPCDQIVHRSPSLPAGALQAIQHLGTQPESPVGRLVGHPVTGWKSGQRGGAAQEEDRRAPSLQGQAPKPLSARRVEMAPGKPGQIGGRGIRRPGLRLPIGLQDLFEKHQRAPSVDAGVVHLHSRRDPRPSGLRKNLTPVSRARSMRRISVSRVGARSHSMIGGPSEPAAAQARSGVRPPGRPRTTACSRRWRAWTWATARRSRSASIRSLKLRPPHRHMG